MEPFGLGLQAQSQINGAAPRPRGVLFITYSHRSKRSILIIPEELCSITTTVLVLLLRYENPGQVELPQPGVQYET
jgi:hypothetical protein